MVLGVSLILLIVGTTALILSNLRQRAILESEQQLLGSANVLSKLAGRDFQAFDLVETNLIEQMEAAAIVSRDLFDFSMAGHDTHSLLREKNSGFPGLDELMLIGADGKLINTSRDWPVRQLDVSDQNYFKALKAKPQLSSLLSEPVFDPQTGHWTIYLSRKFIGPNGEFLGLVTAAIRTEYLEEFYQTLTRGPSDSIALFRDDGLLLARYPHQELAIGRWFPNSAIAKTILASSAPTLARETGAIDGAERLLAVAPLQGSSAYIAASTTLDAALADWRREAEYLIVLTLVLVCAIGGTGAALVRHFRRQSLQLDAALNNLSQGVSMYDADQRLILSNNRYAEIFGLSPDMTKPGVAWRDELADRVARGLYPRSDAAALIGEGLATAAANRPSSAIAELVDGRLLASYFQPMSGGGFVVTVEDITERMRAEKRIAHLANHDYLTNLPNRAAFSDRLAQTIAAAIDAKREFAILCLDLDRFKEVNDLHGHLVGDALLREVARRLERVAGSAFLAQSRRRRVYRHCKRRTGRGGQVGAGPAGGPVRGYPDRRSPASHGIEHWHRRLPE